MRHALYVSTNGEPVGSLGFEPREDRYDFRYEDGWLARRDAFPLSPHIGLDGAAPRTGTLARFIGNLLPEGRALDVASIVYQISKDNIYGLIRMLGKEPVGALSFLAAGEDVPPLPHASQVNPQVDPQAGTQAGTQTSTQTSGQGRRIVGEEELTERIRDRDTIPFPVWDKRVRLSIAGYQDKLQVLVEGSQLSLVDGSPLSSTHILKPESRNPGTPFMVANEHFCMTLAARMGLPAAPVAIRRIPEPILLIERFDRVVAHEAGNPERVAAVRRLHVIDGCQALDLPVSFKYERNFGNTTDVRTIREGASFEKLFALTPYFVTPAAARMFLTRWAVFQLLIGNSDAHGKNLSFFMQRGGLVPAPLYDLVSVNAYGEMVEQEMAMGYGDAFHLGEVTPFELACFAQRTGVQPRYLARELVRMAQAARSLAPELARSALYVGEERGLLQTVSGFIVEQAERLSKMAPEVPKIDRKLL
ncbi:HipA domain-containing protein [Paraburkholderia tagetis]|uniref:HipA domain-containing protein n=1 Tax=Paraburkholderia tagetis TaxID=2913261 RepID=A0A9X1RLQ3_9BURK|nr:HipA domain-containing protein [Paraburkholderia tagetis]MCG5073828.1 HipA domain-containing protein [Paraburkholderia tagetis]